MLKFQAQRNNSQIFKIHAVDLIDRIENILKYAVQFNKISTKVDDKSLCIDSMLTKKATFIQDCYTIFSQKDIKSISEVTEVMLNIIQEYESIISIFQEMQEEQKLILSKISVNKEIFNRIKIQFVKMQRYFYNSQSLIPVIKKHTHAN